jgi:hypothetical protein
VTLTCLVPRPALGAALSILALAALGGCGSDDDPTGPPAGELPMTWVFDAGLDGWDPSEQCNGDPACYPVGMVTQNDGMVILEGAGDPASANASISRSVSLPAGSATIEVRAISSCTGTIASDTDIRILVQAGASETIVQDWIEVDESWTTISAGIAGFAGQQVTIEIEQNDNGEQEESGASAEALCIDEITIAGVD